MNISIGIIGHVDSGKTALSKALSTFQSTAGFDKHPESQRRGITLDVGFSKFDLDGNQFTVVDCPGHAAFIKSVLAGVSIVDYLILVIDGEKLFQQQTLESLVLMELFQKPSFIFVNKMDLLQKEQRAKTLNLVEQTLQKTKLRQFEVCSGSATAGDFQQLLELLKATTSKLIDQMKVQRLEQKEKPLLMHYDHHFRTPTGTVLTGTVLQNSLKVGQKIYVNGGETVVKSLQVFKQPVEEAGVGDRVGVLVKDLPQELQERGVICDLQLLKHSKIVGAKVQIIKHFKHRPKNGEIFNVNFGFENHGCKVHFFQLDVLGQLSGQEQIIVQNVELKKECFAIFVFENPIQMVDRTRLLGLKMDQTDKKQCRIAFTGALETQIDEKQLERFSWGTERVLKLEVSKQKGETVVFKSPGVDLTGIPFYSGEKQVGTVKGAFGQDKFKAELTENLEPGAEFTVKIQGSRPYQW